MTLIFSGGTSKKRRMSRLDVSETVRIRFETRAAVQSEARAYVSASRFGRYSGNIRWMQSWIVTTDFRRLSGGST